MDGKPALEPVERLDGKIDFDGKVYAVASGAVLFVLPGWPVGVNLEQLVLHRSYATYGADGGGDIRPVGGPSLLCIGRIQGYHSKLGVLGAPATLTDMLSVTIYPIREDERGDSDWAQWARRSWPLNVIWRQDPPLEESWFDVVLDIPEMLFLQIANAAAAGHINRVRLDMRLERAFVIDRERPNGAEDEPAFLAPFDERGRQPGPNLGYVSALTIQEHSTGMKKSGSEQDLEAHPTAAQHRALRRFVQGSSLLKSEPPFEGFPAVSVS